MKRFVIYILFCCLTVINSAQAQHMVQKQGYLTDDIYYTGLPDYPPFSKYLTSQREFFMLDSAFLKPLKEIAQKYDFKIKDEPKSGSVTLQDVILDIRSGNAQMFIGAYSDSKLFTGIHLIYPAVVSNPIHIITLPDEQEKIKTTKDLAALKGIISKTEYLSDFVLRKIKPLNLTFAETPYDAYEKLFTGEADYILGGLYYNRIMSSRYGIEQYLAYSKKPLFKIPVFVAMSKTTPKLSLYDKIFSKEFNNPEFGNSVKQEILRMVEDEIAKNQGIVPPAFAKKVLPPTETANQDSTEAPAENKKGRVLEQKIKQKSIDDVLDGI